MSTTFLLNKKTKRPNLVLRYLKFIESRANVKKPGYHLHHILPKSKDFFPEYKNLKEFAWNGVYLSPREHFIAHWMLAVAFPKSTQSLAFYRMVNVHGTECAKNSKTYEASKLMHIEQLVANTQKPERNAKISKALSGKKKSQDHINKLIGHPVTDETREILRQKNIGKTRSKESIEKQKKTYAENPNNVNRHTNNLSVEALKSMSEKKLAEKRKWYNNGKINKSYTIFSPPPDSSWVLGRLPWK